MSDRLPPFSSLHLARAAVAAEFPHHTNVVRKTPQLEEKILAYREKLGEIRRASLELAALELELKREIGFNQGVEVPEVGILYWTSGKTSRKSPKGRVNWMKLAADKGIPEKELDKYRQDVTGERQFFLRRHVHTPEGVASTSNSNTEDVDLDASF